MALLTGGVYTYADTGENAIGRESTPEAFDAVTLALLPCLFITARGLYPSGGLGDAAVRSIRQVAELYFYAMGASGAIEAAAARARQLLDSQVADERHLSWIGDPFGARFDERLLGGCFLLKSEYETIGFT